MSRDRYAAIASTRPRGGDHPYHPCDLLRKSFHVDPPEDGGAAPAASLLITGLSSLLWKAEDVFGSRQQAIKWLHCRDGLLDWRTPYQAAATPQGICRAMRILEMVEATRQSR